MSDIQRYRYAIGENPGMVPCEQGRYCLYSDLAFYRRKYHMVERALVGVCAVFAVFLVFGKHALQPVHKASVQETQPAHAFKEQTETLVYEQVKAEVEQLRRDLDPKRMVRQKKMELHEATAKAQTAKFEGLKQAEAQIPTATPMHDGALFSLAKQVGGFTKVRVVE